MLNAIFVFNMDGTLLSKRTVDVFCAVFNLNERLKLIDKVSLTLPAYRIEEMVAKLKALKECYALYMYLNFLKLV